MVRTAVKCHSHKDIFYSYQSPVCSKLRHCWDALFAHILTFSCTCFATGIRFAWITSYSSFTKITNYGIWTTKQQIITVVFYLVVAIVIVAAVRSLCKRAKRWSASARNRAEQRVPDSAAQNISASNSSRPAVMSATIPTNFSAERDPSQAQYATYQVAIAGPPPAVTFFEQVQPGNRTTMLTGQQRFDPGQLPSFPVHASQKDNPCTICLGPLHEEHVSTGPCLHFMHTSCLSSWLRKDPSCPGRYGLL